MFIRAAARKHTVAQLARILQRSKATIESVLKGKQLPRQGALTGAQAHKLLRRLAGHS